MRAIFQFVVLLALVSYVAASQKPYGVHMHALSCDFSPTLCKDTMCLLKPISRKLSNITTGCYVTQTQSAIKLKVEVFTRSSSNIYRPGSVRFRDDYCEMMRNNKTLIWTAFPKALASITKHLQRCPVIGRHFIEGFLFDSSMLPSSLLPSGDYRMDVHQFNGQNEMMSINRFFFNVKNQFF